MTISKLGFRGEVFQRHKLDHYDAVFEKAYWITSTISHAVTYTARSIQPDRRASKPLIEWVEQMLFGVALGRNPGCRNQRGTRLIRNVEIFGVFNSRPVGRPGPVLAAAHNMFGTKIGNLTGAG